jgi:hypothetical protein
MTDTAQAYEPGNILLSRRGQRSCKACKRFRSRQYRNAIDRLREGVEG